MRMSNPFAIAALACGSTVAQSAGGSRWAGRSPAIRELPFLRQNEPASEASHDTDP